MRWHTQVVGKLPPALPCAQRCSGAGRCRLRHRDIIWGKGEWAPLPTDPKATDRFRISVSVFFSLNRIHTHLRCPVPVTYRTEAYVSAPKLQVPEQQTAIDGHNREVNSLRAQVRVSRYGLLCIPCTIHTIYLDHKYTAYGKKT